VLGCKNPSKKGNMTIKLEANKTVEEVFNNYNRVFIENNLVRWNVAKQDGLTHYPFEDMLNDFYNCDLISKTVRDATVKAREEDDDKFWNDYFGGKL
jgi:hypothetical protein|tara:strand:+ start:274 stop:564 length:291 start_codon:yes stop_codon:yes gene_type:complete